jgi:hypothetical protein
MKEKYSLLIAFLVKALKRLVGSNKLTTKSGFISSFSFLIFKYLTGKFKSFLNRFWVAGLFIEII